MKEKTRQSYSLRWYTFRVDYWSTFRLLFTDKQWTLQTNINNIFDKRYAKAAENSIQWLPESGRNFMVTAILKM